MKKYLQKTLMVMLAAFLSLGIAACSDDDDDKDGGSTKGGKMSGWVEIDGKKYDFTHFYGAISPDKTEVSFNGFSIDPYKMTQNSKYNMTAFSLLFTPDGSALDYDGDSGSLGINFEFEINCDTAESPNMVMYCNLETSLAGVSASRKGDKITIDGKNVEVRYSKPGAGSVSNSDPKTTISFHLEGTPQWLDLDNYDD